MSLKSIRQQHVQEMEWRHDVDIKDVNQASDAEISEMYEVQEREREMEAVIRGTELSALQERRMLNSLLDSVVDSVMSIDPNGTITRFNCRGKAVWLVREGSVGEWNQHQGNDAHEICRGA